MKSNNAPRRTFIEGSPGEFLMEGRECGAQPRPPQADDTSEARVFRRSRNGLRLFPRLSQNSQREKSHSHALLQIPLPCRIGIG